MVNIRTIGLEEYLNSTSDKHRELGYKVFVAMAGKASTQSMARTFGVEWKTMQHWLMIHEMEQKNVQAS